MYLGPHHFQAQSRYFEDVTQFVAESLWFCPWGLLGVEWNKEALCNGLVSLTHARGIFPDGLAFDMPSCDRLPEPRRLEEAFPPTAAFLTARLAIPRRQASAANCDLNGESTNGSSRFIAEERPVFDELTGLDEKPVRFGRKNIRMMLGDENQGECETIPVARILRDGLGHYVYDEAFIPPVLRLNASPALLALTGRLIEVLHEKHEAFRGRVSDFDRQAGGVSGQQVGALWFLHAVNSSLASLRHSYLSAQGHPEELYREYLRLAGALSTFGLDSAPALLPLYDHSELQSCFGQLDEQIRRHLELVIPTNRVLIKLERTVPSMWEGAVSDTRALYNARWFLGISASMGEAELIRQAPQKIKVCSARFVPDLVRRALPGMRLNHVSLPPASLSPKIQMQYFSIDRSGPCWAHLQETGRVGVYIPGDVPDPQLELAAVLES
jgi:type VI secretion system protein ImpJ